MPILKAWVRHRPLKTLVKFKLTRISFWLTKNLFLFSSNILKNRLNNNLLNDIKSLFDGLTSLVTLQIYNNRITKIETFTFNNLTNLQYLDLSYNLISHIFSWSFLNSNKLKYLGFEANRISGISRSAFTNLLDIERVCFQGNEFTGTIVTQLEDIMCKKVNCRVLNKQSCCSNGQCTIPFV